MLIFTRLCQIEIQPHILLIIICVMTGANYTHFYAIVPKQPPPNAFFEACSLFKEKNFGLICESCLLFFMRFLCDIIGGIATLVHFLIVQNYP